MQQSSTRAGSTLVGIANRKLASIIDNTLMIIVSFFEAKLIEANANYELCLYEFIFCCNVVSLAIKPLK